MKLLSPREIETHTTADRYSESEHLQALRSQISREESEFRAWESEMNLKRREATDDLDEKILGLNKKITSLEDEVVSLEKKRAILLQPLDDTPEVITKNLAVTEEMLQYLKIRKADLFTEKEMLVKLQERAKNELETLLLRENTLNRREVETAKREKTVKTEELHLSESIEKFSTEANRRNIELMLYQDKLNKKEVEIAEREKLIASDNERIAIDRRRIESQQQTLIAAMAEAKQNNLI